MATRRANHAATASPATAKRGRLSERAWSDVLRAAHIARAEGVALRVHGIEIYNKRKPLKLKSKVCVAPGAEKPTETVAPTLPSTANGVKPPPPHSKRQQRSALRLQEFQEKKRAAAVQDFVTQGVDPVVAQEKVARLERKRLERIAADCVAPMEAEPSIEGRPPGEQERQPRGQVARPKRARGSGRPETG